MVKNKTIRKMEQEPRRFKRIVGPHKRISPIHNKPIQIEGYAQGYNSPRGKIRSVKPDRLTKRSQTMWLMNKYGHFVGRANFEGKTSAQNISKFGYDTTTVVRDEKKFKRVFGRLRSE